MASREINGRLYKEDEYFKECTDMSIVQALKTLTNIHKFFSTWNQSKYKNRKLYSLRRLSGAETWIAISNKTDKPVFIDKDSLSQCVYIQPDSTRYAISAMNYVELKSNDTQDRILLTIW